MDTIYKTINIDNSRSHMSGLLPFVHFGNNNIENVTLGNHNGNYGNYVCDFCIFSDEKCKHEISRLKYLDILRWYNEIDEILKKSIFVKKVTRKKEKIVKIDCKDKSYSDPETIVKKEVEDVISFYTDFKEKDDFDRLSFIPINKKYFTNDGIFYELYETNEYFDAVEKEEDKRSDEEKAIIDDVEKHKALISSENNTYFIMLSNYDHLCEINKIWKEWWINNFEDEDWETLIFDGYISSQFDELFKFCYDVERYILGKQNVYGKNIKGKNVPNVVYYTTIHDSKIWFETNSASTISAYANPKENEWLIKSWEDKGGGEYYDFINNIIVNLQKNKKVKNKKGNKVFSYSVPLYEIDTLINSEYDYETLYSTYEYSIERHRKVGAVKEYLPSPIEDIVYLEYAVSGDTDNKLYYCNSYYKREGLDSDKVVINDNEYFKLTENSVKTTGLTKQWVEFSANTLMCESKLRTLVHAGSVTIDNEIKGLYKFFNEDDENGQLFKCTYMSGWSESALCNVIIYEKETDYVYHYDEEGNKIEEEKTFYNDTLSDVTFDEIPPLVNEETYQVVGLTVIDTEEEVKTSETGTNLYESAFTRYQYAWWNCEKVNEDEIKNFICGDGEAIGKNNDEKYRNITILSSIENMITNKEFGDYYYFLARFDNGISEPLDVKGSGGTINSIKIPYKVDCPVNIVEYDDGTITYDVVTEIDDSTSKDGYITIRYSKGVTSGATEKTGILYEEKITYLKDAVEYSAIDGAYLSEIIVNKLLLNESEVDVYSEEYKLTRKCNLASIIGMEVGTQWTKDAAIDAMLITKDGYEGLYWEPKYNVDIIYNRGNASAWEKRFKLTECNTMEDLTNYGNNFFNL